MTVALVMPFLRLAMKLYFRSEVRDMDRLPEGGVLIVSNHSGGLLPMDVPIIAVAHRRGVRRGPAALLLVARRPVHRPAPSDHAPVRPDPGHAGERPPGAHVRRRHHRLPRRRLRRAATAGQGQRDRLQRPHRLRPHRDRGRRPDPPRGLHRRPGRPVPHLPRRDARPLQPAGSGVGRACRTSRSASGSRSASPRPSRSTSRCRRRSPRRCSSRSTSPPSSVPNPTSREVDAEIRSRMQEALDVLASQRRFPVLG